MNIASVAKTITLTSSAAARMIKRDPLHFATQLSRRLRLAHRLGPITPLTSRIPILATILDQPGAVARRDPAHQALAHGELSEARLLARSRIRAERLLDEESLLTAVPATFAPHVSQPTHHRESSGISVLHVLTNSLPHTHSGYALRSQAILAAQQRAGIMVSAATRLGYPATIGRLVTSDTEMVDDVRYHRLLPWVLPARLSDRQTLTVDMLRELVEETGAHVLHTTTDYRNGLVTEAAARATGRPWVYEVRGNAAKTWLSRVPAIDRDRAERSQLYRYTIAQEARIAARADHVVALSEVSAQELCQWGVPEERITIVPNSIDDTLLDLTIDRSSARQRCGLPSDVPIVGSISACVGYEGQATLIDALDYLPSDWHVLIVGDGTELPALRALADQSPHTQRIMFAGRQPHSDIHHWYASLDVFAVPRRDTNVSRTVTPIKALTAQALGIPVVASDLPALREVTGGIETYTTPEDPEALAQGIRAAASSVSAGRTWAATRTWSRAASHYRDIYRLLLGLGR